MAKYGSRKGMLFMGKEYDKLTIRILNRLDFNTQPSSVQLSISSEDLKNKLYEMRDDELVTFDVIKKHLVFGGDPKNVRITDKGKLVLNENKHKIDIF